MKNFQAIISNLYNQDNFKNLYTIEIINKLIATLPYNLRKSFMYSSIKNEILLLAFDHPTSVSEFNNYKKIIMLNTLEQLKIINQDSVQFQKLHRIKDIKAYLPKNILNRFDIGDIDIEYKVIEYYKERSSGDFIIDENGPYKKEFLAIKNAIKNNNESNK